jgi:TolA-binding protein
MRVSEEDLLDIKRELIESRGLVIKTNNLAAALSADLRAIAKRQQGYERKISWNSAVAYVVFVVVVLLALKFAWDSQLDQVAGKNDALKKESERLREENKDLRKQVDDRARSDLRSFQFYELIRQGKRADVMEAYEQVKKEPLTRTELAMFEDAIEKTRNELAGQMYAQGLDKMRVQRWQEAANAFEEALKHKEESIVAPQAKLGLAEAYRKLNRQKDAIVLLSALVQNPVNKEIHDDALYHLAWCQMDVQAWNDAKDTWRMLIRKYPETRFAAEGKVQLSALNILH